MLLDFFIPLRRPNISMLSTRRRHPAKKTLTFLHIYIYVCIKFKGKITI